MQIVLYRVCNFEISGMMTSVFVFPESGHFMLFLQYCMFQLVFDFTLDFFPALYLWLLVQIPSFATGAYPSSEELS